MFWMWETMVLKSLIWVHGLERKNLIVDFLLVGRLVQGDLLGKHDSTINSYSFGSFLAAKAMEFGGAVSMSTKLVTEEDLTELFCDYYRFLIISPKVFRC